MARDSFHSHTHHHDTHMVSHPDIGQQILNFIKFAIFFLIALKIIQLIFLKYRRKLSLPERVERKYKYSHNELINEYSEPENKLMRTTIDNTIKNTQVETKGIKKVKKGLNKKVMFQVEKNVYYDPKLFKDQEDSDEATNDSGSKFSVISRVDSLVIKEDKKEETHLNSEEKEIKDDSEDG